MKRVFAAVAVAVLALSLAGCMNLRGDLKVGRDAKVNGTLTAEFDKRLASIAGITSLDSLKAQGAGEASRFGKVSYDETDSAYVIKVTMRGATMNDPDGFMVTRSNDTIAFRFKWGDPSNVSTGEDFGLGNMELGRVVMTIRFPGQVTSLTGPGSVWRGRTVKINAPLSMNSSPTWTATSKIAPPNYVVPIVAGLIGLAVLAVVLFLLLRRRRQREEPPAEPAAVE